MCDVETPWACCAFERSGTIKTLWCPLVCPETCWSKNWRTAYVMPIFVFWIFHILYRGQNDAAQLSEVICRKDLEVSFSNFADNLLVYWKVTSCVVLQSCWCTWIIHARVTEPILMLKTSKIKIHDILHLTWINRWFVWILQHHRSAVTVWVKFKYWPCPGGELVIYGILIGNFVIKIAWELVALILLLT